MKTRLSLSITITLILILSTLNPSLVIAESPQSRSTPTVEESIFFSADISSLAVSLRRIDVDGGNESLLLGPPPLNEFVYAADEERFYGVALDNTIRRMNRDGTGVETLLAGRDGPSSLRLDSVGGKIYWIDNGRALFGDGREIWRANPDGSDSERIISPANGFGTFDQLTLAPTLGKLYFVAEDEIIWANLDGSSAEVVATATGGVNPELYCPLVDGANQRLYWLQYGGSSSNAFFRANLDGSDAQPIVPLPAFTDAGCPFLGQDGQEIIWPTGDDNTVKRADLDGGNVATILTNVNNSPWFQPGPDGTFFWSRSSGGQVEILQGDRASGEVQTVLSGLTQLRALTVVAGIGGLFWIDQAAHTVNLGRANLDGSNPQILRASPRDVRGIGLDADGGHFYFANEQTVSRVNPDGSDLEILITRSAFVEALALDLVNGKLYWSEGGSSPGIFRAALDGSNVEEVFLHAGGGSVTSFFGIALDVSGGKLYFSYYIFGGAPQFNGSIWQANLDGSDAEALVTGLEIPRGLALDREGGQIYWADSRTGKIQRATLADGGDVTDLVTADLQMPHGVAVDAANGHLYWADSAARTIRRATLNGENPIDLYTGPAAPYNLIVVAPLPSGDNGALDRALYLPLVVSD
ncbi:MAG: SMP-30/gluconolactonase/LRE family protein [Caldilineaceae bacterium]|nr:SMP-30/gluconolactonase/LRE family protein [Caldilineaceae bacterium]